MAELSGKPKDSFAQIDRGDQLAPFELTISAEDVALYLEATGESDELWARYVPPLALVAFALGGLMDRVEVPSGLVHTGQEFDFCKSVVIGESVEVEIKVASSSRRRGVRMVVFATELFSAGAMVGSGRTTVMLAPEDGESQEAS